MNTTRVILAVVALAALGAGARAGTVDFELPYIVGGLNGQQGWTASGQIEVTNLYAAPTGTMQSLCNVSGSDAWASADLTGLAPLVGNATAWDVYIPSGLDASGTGDMCLMGGSFTSNYAFDVGVRTDGTDGAARVVIINRNTSGNYVNSLGSTYNLPLDSWIRMMAAIDPATGDVTVTAQSVADHSPIILMPAGIDPAGPLPTGMVLTNPYLASQSAIDALTDVRVFDKRIAMDNIGLTMGVPGPHPGDANHDEVVDLQDFGLLKDNFGVTSGAAWEQGDFNADGAIDLQDFGVLKDHFGHTLGDTPVTAVPEPASAFLFVGLLAALRRRSH